MRKPISSLWLCGLILLSLMMSIVAGNVACNFRFGDPAVTIRYDNRRDEPVTVSYLST